MSEKPSLTLTIADCVSIGAQQFIDAKCFFGHGTDNAEDEALWLVFYVLDIGFDIDETILQRIISDSEWQQIQSIFQRRINERVPAAYITGQAWFCGYEFIVNEHVLVPRSPIGELIENAFSPWLKTPPNTVLDLCTGCGCIGISTALCLPQVQVDLSDISAQALKLAQKNIDHYNLKKRVTAIQSDLFQDLQGRQYDLILSNPPYVDAQDIASMPAEYQAEPTIALGSGDDGLDITRRILRESADYLTEGGVLIVEVGNSWENLEQTFPQVPFMWLEFESGGHGVFVMTRKELAQYSSFFSC